MTTTSSTFSQTPSPNPHSRIWFLRGTALFEDQTESLYQSLDRRSSMVEFKRGDLLSADPEFATSIYLIEEGQVKLRALTDGGKEIIIDVVGERDVFGPLSQALGTPETQDWAAGRASAPAPDALGNALGKSASRPGNDPALLSLAAEAVAMTNGSALRYSMEYFRRMVMERPTVLLNVTRLLGLRQRRLELRLARLLYRTCLGKVAGLICELADRYGEPGEEAGTTDINLRLTHQEIASVVGAKRETVSEAMAELELRELIRSKRTRITVMDLAALDRIP